MIDTHTHIYQEEFDADRSEVVARAQEAGVRHIILPNVDFESYDAMMALHNEYPEYTSVAMGFHPTSVNADYEHDLQRTLDCIRQGGWVAVGEVGMDLYWDKTFVEQQKVVLATQMELARNLGLPVIIHCRDAVKETLDVIDSFHGDIPQIVFHSFTGTPDEVKEIRKRGDIHFGINGIVTFKNGHLEETAKEVGINRLMLETDSPYLAPVPKRGRRNESSFVPYVANKLSEIFDISVDKVSEITDETAIKFFNLPL